MPTKLETAVAQRTAVCRGVLLLDRLPRETVSTILFFLSLDELLDSVRPVCPFMEEACDNDPRWLPIIAPPSLSHEVLSLGRHGTELRGLYLAYKQWRKRWHELRLCGSSARDGFFSLAPWRHEPDGLSSSYAMYPTPWLHRMVYQQSCPSTTTDIDGGVALSARPTKRPRHPQAGTVSFNIASAKKDQQQSTFFRQRNRSSTIQWRIFSSDPIEPILPFYAMPRTTRGIIIQPVNFRKQEDGSKLERLPDHNLDDLRVWNDACVKLLECYFCANTSNTNEGHRRAGRSILVSPCINHPTDLRINRKVSFCRTDKQGLVDDDNRPVLQVNAYALKNLGGSLVDAATESHNSEDDDNGDDARFYIIAPHMYTIDEKGRGKDFAWIYSTPNSDGATISTFQLYQHIRDPKQRVHHYAHFLLRSILHTWNLSICENLYCALNNSDSVEETESDSHLILCPACIRKLQLCGVLGEDVMEFLDRLANVLGQEPFVDTCQDNLRLLRGEYGVVPMA